MFLVLTFQVCAQVKNQPVVSKEEADRLFEKEEFRQALLIYSELLKKSPADPALNYKAAVSAINSNSDRSKALSQFEKAESLKNKEKEFLFYRARAFHLNYKFDQAIAAYEEYYQSLPEKQKKKVSRFIQNCQNGKELLQFPLDVDFENLGKNVNTEFPEYLPLLPTGENFIMFTSRRKPVPKEDKTVLYADVYISEVKNGSFAKAKELGPPVNTAFNEEGAGLSADGKTLFLNVDNMEGSGVNDIFLTTGKGKTFQRPYILGKNINTDDHFETSATITPDGNTLIFVSDKPGGKGGRDIYFSNKLPTGDWGIANNIPILNSEFDEEYPFLTEDGKTLYFSSNGHNSIGGFDIFKSSWSEDSKTWTEPKNIGYPINTPGDEWSFVSSSDGREAYIAAVRPEGFGDWDIYKITFNQIDPKYTVFKGVILGADSTNIKAEVSITINNKKNKSLFGLYTVPAAKNGKYIFYLPPGKYEVNIESPEFKTLQEEITVLDKSAFKPEIAKNFVIYKPGQEPVKSAGKSSAAKSKKDPVKKKS